METKDKKDVETRRTLLKLVSAAATATSGISALSGQALAGGNSGSEISVGEEDVIATAPAGGGATDDEWEVSHDEQDSQVYIDLLWFANPGELPLDYCTDLENGNDLCIQTADQFQKGYRNCASGQTPYLHSIDITLKEWESGSLRTELDMWIGLDEYYCLWVGQEDTAMCASDLACHLDQKYQAMFSDPGTWVNAAQTIPDWIEDNEDEIIDNVYKFTKGAIYVIVLFVIIVIISILTAMGVSGTS